MSSLGRSGPAELIEAYGVNFTVSTSPSRIA
jgi:hypothetical protein